MNPVRTLRARGLLAAVALTATLAAAIAPAACTRSSGVASAARRVPEIPARLSDTTFWRLVTEFSEPGGYFRSDNFVSNDTSFQYVIPELQRTTTPRGVYLGVAPDQNFSYIVALRPRIAFIVDIRRQNMMQHLMYKALIEMSADRAEFLSRLFARERPAGLDTTTTVETLFAMYEHTMPDSGSFRRNLTAIVDRLTKDHGYALSAADLESIEYVYRAFVTAGPDLTYGFPGGGRGGIGGIGGRWPSYAQLMLENDGEGTNRSYMGSEASFRTLKEYQANNLIVPIVGDFSGDKALRAVGRYVREHGGTVTAFYTSNVEQYLFQQGDDWSRFYDNVAALPIDSTSLFIRSLSNGGSFRPGSPRSRSRQLVASIAELLAAHRAGQIEGYFDVIERSR